MSHVIFMLSFSKVWGLLKYYSLPSNITKLSMLNQVFMKNLYDDIFISLKTNPKSKMIVMIPRDISVLHKCLMLQEYQHHNLHKRPKPRCAVVQ